MAKVNCCTNTYTRQIIYSIPAAWSATPRRIHLRPLHRCGTPPSGGCSTGRGWRVGCCRLRHTSWTAPPAWDLAGPRQAAGLWGQPHPRRSASGNGGGPPAAQGMAPPGGHHWAHLLPGQATTQRRQCIDSSEPAEVAGMCSPTAILHAHCLTPTGWLPCCTGPSDANLCSCCPP